MHTQTLQRLRSEVEAASTLHLALGRIAQKANPDAPTGWTGPLLEELEDLTDDDGGFSHAGLAEIRRRSGSALIAQYHAVKAAVDGAPTATRPHFQALLDATLVTGTGNASVAKVNGAVMVLSNLVKSGELRLDFTMQAAMLARDGLPTDAPAPRPHASAPRPPRASAPESIAVKKPKKKAPTPKKVTKPKAPAKASKKKPAPKKKAVAAKAKSTPKAKAKKPAGKRR